MTSRAAGVAALLTLLLTLASARVVAAEEDGDELQGGWEFQAIPYFWLPATHGTISIGDLSADLDIGLGDAFDLLGDGDLIGGMGRFEARRGPGALFVDASGAVIDEETDGEIARDRVGVDADLNFSIAIVELGAAYRFLTRGRLALDGLAGARYTYAYTGITVDAADARRSENATTNIVDPFLGGRAAIQLAEQWSLLCRGDVGGFGVGSELAWTAFGGVLWDTPWRAGAARFSLFLGYKVYGLDYETGSGRSAQGLDVVMQGPAFGTLFTF